MPVTLPGIIISVSVPLYSVKIPSEPIIKPDSAALVTDIAFSLGSWLLKLVTPRPRASIVNNKYLFLCFIDFPLLL